MDRMRNDTKLTSLVADAHSIYPDRQGGFGPNMKSPSLLLTGLQVSTTDDIVSSVNPEFWVFDVTSQSYWRIDDIIRRLHQLFNLVRVGPVREGVVDELLDEFTSDEFSDDTLNRNVRYARYRGWLIN